VADKTTTSALSEKEAQSLLERMVFLQFQGKFDEAADVNQMLYEGGWVVMIHRYLERRTDRHGPVRRIRRSSQATTSTAPTS